MERFTGSTFLLALVTVALTGCGANYSKTVASSVTTSGSGSGSGTTAAALAAPTFSIAGGSFTSAQDVSLSSSVSGAVIYYTIDGTTPTTASPVYTATVHVAQTMAIEAMAAGVTGYTQSLVATQTYTISSATPVIATTVVNQSLPSVTIPTSFLGYSHSWDAVAHILGDSTTTTNYIYRQLTSNLSTLMGGPLVVRVGGEPTAQATQETVRPMTELVAASGVKLLLSVNLEASDLALAQQQAETYMAYVPSASLTGIEIGNEPDNYVTAGYRQTGYAYTDFFPQYQQWVNGLSAVTNATAPIAGPVFSSIQWIPNATTDVTNATMQAAIVTQHHYIGCYYADAPLATNILLQPSSSSGVLPYFQPFVTAAHAKGAPFRVAELNSICIGGQPGVSNSFSSALWGIDMMFGFASIGVDGVNWHTDSDGGVYDLYHFFTFKNQYYLENVNPLFYGLQFFAGAAGNGAQLLQASTSTSSNIKVWVTKNSNTGHAHLMIINKEISTAGNVQVTMPGYTTGVLTTLNGANYLATSGITIGGQTYDGSTDGTLQGTPVTQTITPTKGVWTVPVQAMSAVSVDLQN